MDRQKRREYEKQYRAKNAERLKYYRNAYMRAYRKGEKYSSKDKKEATIKALRCAILSFNEYRKEQVDTDNGFISDLYELAKQLNNLTDRFEELTTKEDFL
jgi:hypothetical protein